MLSKIGLKLLQLLLSQLEPLAEQQLMGIYNLQQSSQQTEDALSQGMDALQQSLSETLACTCSQEDTQILTASGDQTVSLCYLCT